ncbi:SGS domain-containing protein [Calycina marina]|uniref:SGS domain-containing protein n=1 Tax=Calycina marina TaxID=1763456 RepID=A0A9P7YY86_9HELO|nr:SGS domain-containing protein [Calycina marina]
MSSSAAAAAAAMNTKDYATAISNLTAALKTNTSNPSPIWLIQRSTAYQRSQQYELSLIDANNAVVAARSRGRRDLIGTAQFRRGVALNSLQHYGDARLCFTWALKMNDKEKGVTIYMAKNTSDYEKAEAEDSGSKSVWTSVKEYPERIEDVNETAKVSEPTRTAETKDRGKEVVGSTSKPAVLAPTILKEKIRTEWYQNPTTVTISIMAKGVPNEKAEVFIKQNSLEVSFPTTDTDTYDYTLSPLLHKIDTSNSSFRITPHKIEITLAKSVAGTKWATLEGNDIVKQPEAEVKSSTVVPPAAVFRENDKPPAYPTSSRRGPKNWDTVTNDADLDEGGDEMNSFFQRLYKDADPDTKRAMMKSYQESNGTALSTNWADVGKKTVETSPPEGVEAKPW